MNQKYTPGPWKVEADPEWKGKHPLHDCRFITSGKHSIEDDEFRFDPDCQIIAKMTDCQNQRANALLIAAVPDLLSFIQSAIDCECFDGFMLKQAKDLISKASPSPKADYVLGQHDSPYHVQSAQVRGEPRIYWVLDLRSGTIVNTDRDLSKRSAQRLCAELNKATGGEK